MELTQWVSDLCKYVYSLIGVEGLILIIVGFLLAKATNLIRNNLHFIIIGLVAVIIAVVYYGVALPSIPSLPSVPSTTILINNSI